MANTLTIYETSHSTQTNRPVSITRAFRRGEITGTVAAYISGTALTTQCDVKNTWPDGSVMFALLTFLVPTLTPDGSVEVSFSALGVTAQATPANLRIVS